MSNDNVNEEAFFHQEPLSLRPVSREWVNNRARELNPTEPDIHGALTEAVERLLPRAAWNLAENGSVVVYVPDGENDPYVVGIPLKKHSRNTRHKLTPPSNVIEPRFVDARRGNLVDDFENVVFEMDFDLTPKDLDRDNNGRYINAHVRALFDGFKMYHDNLTMARSEKFRDSYNRTLGRYVLATVANNGVAVFSKSPFRHLSKAVAIEEANRLSEQLAKPVGVFRCLDIIVNTDEVGSSDE